MLQDNALTQTSQAAVAVAAERDFKPLPHTPYPLIWHRTLKSNLREWHFDSDEDVIGAVESCLNHYDEKFFLR